MEAVKCPFKILIADGSLDDQNKQIIDANKHRFPNVDFEYHRFLPDNTILDFEKKMADALSMVKTPYIKWTSNDDFCILSTVFKCIEFLEKDVKQEYIGCGGTTYRLVGALDRLTLVKHKVINYEFLQENALDRILNQIPYNGSNVQHGVLRTTLVQKAFETEYNLNINSSHVQEYFCIRKLLLYGKYKHLKAPIIIWNKGNSSWSMSFCTLEQSELQKSNEYLFDILQIKDKSVKKKFFQLQSCIRNFSIYNMLMNYSKLSLPLIKAKYTIEKFILHILPSSIKQKTLQLQYRNNNIILSFINTINNLFKNNIDFYHD